MSDWTIGHWLSLGQFAWLIALTLGTWLRKPGDDAGRAVAELEKASSQRDALVDLSIEQLRGRCDLIEQRLSQLPTHRDMQVLLDGVADLRGRVASVADGQARQQHVLNLIQEFMAKK